MPSGSLTFAVITKNRTNPAYAGARAGVDRILAEMGAQAIHFVPQKPDDIDEQANLVSDAIAARPDVIMLAPAHETRMRQAIERIAQSGIPLVCIVSNPRPSPAVTFVGSDNEALGAAMARRLAEQIGSRGKVAIVNGHVNAATSAPRRRGFHKGLAEFPDVTVISECDGEYQRDVAYAAFSQELREMEELDGVIVANDYMALGVLDALREDGRDVPMIGANVTPAGVALIKQGKLIASAAFDALSMGAVAAQAAVRHLDGQEVPREILLPAELVDIDNLGDWDCDYDDRGAVSWDAAIAAQKHQSGR